MIPSSLATLVDLSRYTSYRTPAIARYFYDIRTQDDVRGLGEVFAWIRAERLPHIFIGGGTNLLFACDTYDGIVLHNSLRGIERVDDTVTVASGELMTPLSAFLARECGRTVFERWVGLPGTVGGAVVGNAGCYGLEMSARVVAVDAYDLRTCEMRTLSRDDLLFGYRDSRLKRERDLFVTSVVLDMAERAEDATLPLPSRTTTQPRGFTCGSFFKNPKPLSAGRLIDETGLKGYRVGDAEISPIHANFIMNLGHASWRDILTVAEYARETVEVRTGVRMEEEVRIVR